MKQFMLPTNEALFNENDKSYKVWLGNRAGITFTSKRNANYFVADTNRFLTVQMIELNIYLKEIFCQYRDMWFTLQNFKNGKPVNLSDVERKVEKNLNDAADQFSRAGNTYRGSSSGGWAFKYLENICDYLITATDEMMIVYKKRNNTISYHNLAVIRNNINLVADRIMKYPVELPPGGISISRN